MATAEEVAKAAERRDIRDRWLLSAPALLVIFLAATGPLLIVLVYSFLTPGAYGDVKWQFSSDAWLSVFMERDIFDDTLSLAAAHVTIFWRSIKLAVVTTLATLALGFPTAYFMATRSEKTRDLWLFLITIPFWTNLLIRRPKLQQCVKKARNHRQPDTWMGSNAFRASPQIMRFVVTQKERCCAANERAKKRCCAVNKCDGTT